MSRALRQDEREILAKMIGASADKPESYLSQLEYAQVFDMKDGGMGSIRFDSLDAHGRSVKCSLAKGKYIDQDGIEVLLDIYLDQFDKLFELDIWKVTFQPLVKYPSQSELDIQPLA